MSTLSLLKRAAIGLSVAAPVVMAILPGTASAYRAYPAAGCTYETDYVGDYVWSMGIANQSSGISPRARNIRCPIIDDNSGAPGATTSNVSWRPAVSSIYVTGYDGNNGTTDYYNAQATVCYVFREGTGSSCSTPKVLRPIATDVTFTGPFQVALDAAQVNKLKEAWQGDYSFIQIQIPHNGPLGNSAIYGYSTY